MKSDIVPLGSFLEEVKHRIGEDKKIVYSVTNDRGFVPSLETFDKQVFSADISNYKLVRFDELAYNPSRINVGSIAICPDKNGGAVSPMYTIIKCKDGLLPKYLLYFLKSGTGKQQINHRAEGAVRFQLKFKDLQRIPIYLPPLPEQERIVRLLDEAESLRTQRTQANERMEDFVPALFEEMFGDPATNPKKWAVVLTEKLFTQTKAGTKCGPFGSALKKSEYVNSGIPVWGIDNVQENEFIEENSLFITQEKFKELSNYGVDAGDILISRAGTVGRMCVAYPKQSPSIIGTNLIRLSFDQNKVVPEYFTAMAMYFSNSLGNLRANADETAYSFVSTKTLKSLLIPVPPLALQQEFAERVKEAREIQSAQGRSTERVEALYQSMLDRAFKGEL